MKRAAFAWSPVPDDREIQCHVRRAQPLALVFEAFAEILVEQFLARVLCGLGQGPENTCQVVFDDRRPSNPFGVRYPLLDLRQESICRLLALQLDQFGLLCLEGCLPLVDGCLKAGNLRGQPGFLARDDGFGRGEVAPLSCQSTTESCCTQG